MTQSAQPGDQPALSGAPNQVGRATIQDPGAPSTPSSGLPQPPSGYDPNYNPNNEFSQAANAQGASGVANVNAQTVANRADQSNPFGTSEWSQDPTTGQWTQNVSLAGQQQTALGAQQDLQAGRSTAADSLLGSATSSLAKPLDTSGLNPLFSFGAPGQTNQQAQDAEMAQIQPIMDQNSKALDAQLANQGITPGSEAYQNAHDQLARNNNNLTEQAVGAGFAQGNTENTQNINYANAQQQQNTSNLQQQEFLQQEPLNNINALVNGQQVTDPTFGTYGQAGVAAPTPDLTAAQSNYGATLDSQNASAASSASLDQGLFGLGGAFLGSQAGSNLVGSLGSSAGGYLSSLFGLGG